MSEIFKQRLLYTLLLICIGMFIATFTFFLLQWDTFLPQLTSMLNENNPTNSDTLIIHNITVISTLALFSVTISPWFLAFWKKQRNDMYLFFICLYLFSFAFELARVWIAWITVYPIAKSYAYTLSRVVYFGRIISISCLLVSSTFTIRQPKKNIGGLLIILLLVSLTLAYIMPIDTSRITNTFLFSVGENISLDSVLNIITFISCVNYIILIAQLKRRKYSIAMVLFIAFVIGKQLIEYVYTPVLLYTAVTVVFVAGILSILFHILVLRSSTIGIKTRQ